MHQHFKNRLVQLKQAQHQLLTKQNKKIVNSNGVFCRYQNTVLTAAHTPLNWRYDLNETTNPFLMERFAINAVFNAGAIPNINARD